MGVLGDELTSCGMGVLLLRASGCLLSEHFTVGVVVLGVSVVSGTSPNFTLFFKDRKWLKHLLETGCNQTNSVPVIRCGNRCTLDVGDHRGFVTERSA